MPGLELAIKSTPYFLCLAAIWNWTAGSTMACREGRWHEKCSTVSACIVSAFYIRRTVEFQITDHLVTHQLKLKRNKTVPTDPLSWQFLRSVQTLLMADGPLKRLSLVHVKIVRPTSTGNDKIIFCIIMRDYYTYFGSLAFLVRP